MLTRVCLLLLYTQIVMSMESSATTCEGGEVGMLVHMPVNEFARSYASTFRMSDGSQIVDSDVGDMEHMDAAFTHMKTLMTSVGATKVSTNRHSYDNVGHTVEICGYNMTRILMLAVLGNFVSNPKDPKYGSQSAADTMATVVVDYTGSLVIVHAFATMRTYFLETLLFISIVAIARLSLIKKVTYRSK
jgi:hypothetical protein